MKIIGKAVTVTWTQPDSDGGAEISGYDIAYLTADDAIAQHVAVGVTTTVQLNEKFRRGKSYVFAVAAKNAVGLGDFSYFSECVQIPKITGDNFL